MKLTKLIAACVVLQMVSGVQTFAQTAPTDLAKYRADVLDCVSRMEVQTTWAQCRTFMFSVCPTEVVGNEQHLACLSDKRAEWEGEMQAHMAQLSEEITPSGMLALTEIVAGWVSAVSQNCRAVGIARAEISQEAAETGCHISEVVGLTAELNACLDGRSKAPYCEIRDE